MSTIGYLYSNKNPRKTCGEIIKIRKSLAMTHCPLAHAKVS